MCTVFKIKNKDSYLGRNLDIDVSYNEKVIALPRNYPIKYKKLPTNDKHYAIIGMGTSFFDFPFYYDCCNEFGLSFAGLNFPNNAKYYDEDNSKINVAPYELPLYLLSQYKTVKEVKKALKDINIVDIPFNSSFPLATLHFMVSDLEESITIETLDSGIKIYENPVEVLTNNPLFNEHLENLNNYKDLSIYNKEKTLPKDQCVGLGGIGLPGDSSSKSRFVKTCFLKSHLDLNDNENYNVNQVMHVLDNVAFIKGTVLTLHNTLDYTVYSSCINMTKGIYYYKTYENSTIRNYNIIKEGKELVILDL